MTNRIKTPISSNIKALRKAKGWNSAQALAEKADLPYPTLRDIEAGISQGRPETLKKIADVLGVTIADLHKDPHSQPESIESKDRNELLGIAVAGLSTLNDSQLRKIIGQIEAFNESSGSSTMDTVKIKV